jgi:hypothetical protein
MVGNCRNNECLWMTSIKSGTTIHAAVEPKLSLLHQIACTNSWNIYVAVYEWSNVWDAPIKRSFPDKVRAATKYKCCNKRIPLTTKQGKNELHLLWPQQWPHNLTGNVASPPPHGDCTISVVWRTLSFAASFDLAIDVLVYGLCFVGDRFTK